MKVPKNAQKNRKGFPMDFRLKTPVIRLTNLKLIYPKIVLTDLKHLPQTITLEGSPEIKIRNDLGVAVTDEDEDGESTQIDNFVETAIEHKPGCFDENDDSENESVNVTKGDESLICNLCSKTFIGRSAKLNHILNCHSADLVFVCTNCDACFKNEETLEKHLLVHEKGYPFACTKCQITFNNAIELKFHNAINHAERKWKKSNFVKKKNNFNCSTCELSYDKKSDLLKHIMKLHTRRLVFACKKCKTSFSEKCCPNKHSKKHKHKKKYVCSICSCGFQDRPSLKEHVTVHINEKIFKCSTCGRGFRSLKILKRHILAHTGETPYKCSKCDASYTRKFILIEHMQQIVCHKCREVFYCKTNFDEHYENCLQSTNHSWPFPKVSGE